MKQFLFIFLFLPVIIQADNKKFDSTVVTGIRQIYNMEFDRADRLFKNLMADYPSHPAGKFFIAMIDWWKILLDIDNENHDDIFFAKLEDVIYQCDEILDKNPSNVDALFFKGGAIGFRGRLRALRESWIKAADDGREAMPIVHKAWKLDPENTDVQLGFGIYNYYAAVIPEKFPVIKPLMIFFPNGDKQKGIKELMHVAEHGKYARVESKYFLMTLYYQFEEDYNKAIKYAEDLVSEFPDNPLFNRYVGRISVRQGNYLKAVETFRKVYIRCDQNFPQYNDVAKREASYYLGYFYRMYNNNDSSLTFFKECLDLSRKLDKDEESGFMVNAVLYLGMLNDQMNKRTEALKYYDQLLDMRDYQNSHAAAKRYIEQPYGKAVFKSEKTKE